MQCPKRVLNMVKDSPSFGGILHCSLHDHPAHPYHILMRPHEAEKEYQRQELVRLGLKKPRTRKEAIEFDRVADYTPRKRASCQS